MMADLSLCASLSPWHPSSSYSRLASGGHVSRSRGSSAGREAAQRQSNDLVARPYCGLAAGPPAAGDVRTPPVPYRSQSHQSAPPHRQHHPRRHHRRRHDTRHHSLPSVPFFPAINDAFPRGRLGHLQPPATLLLPCSPALIWPWRRRRGRSPPSTIPASAFLTTICGTCGRERPRYASTPTTEPPDRSR